MFDNSILLAEKITQVFALAEEVIVSGEDSGVRMRGRQLVIGSKVCFEDMLLLLL